MVTGMVGQATQLPPPWSFGKIKKKQNTEYKWARGSVVVKALCYKPEGRGLQTR
jgi:hypothetical protein